MFKNFQEFVFDMFSAILAKNGVKLQVPTSVQIFPSVYVKIM